MKNKYAYIMKTKYIIAVFFAILVSMVGCDKDFVEINTDPLSPTYLDPGFLLPGTEDMAGSEWWYEACIIQQIHLIISGQEAAGNFNILKTNFTGGQWSRNYGNIKTLVDILENNKESTRTNLLNMARIIKAWSFMRLVDTYGDVPYYDAGLGYIEGNFHPVYDDQEEIYEQIETEIKNATDALDPNGDEVPNEMYFDGDIAKWKKLGNSLLLRLGMRYSKSNPTKAAQIVGIATDPSRGGIITTNDENVRVPYNGTQNNPTSGLCRNSTKQNWHIGKPFVDFLKETNDPRTRYLIARYMIPQAPSGVRTNDNPAQQVGAPIGSDANNITDDPDYPGTTFGYYYYSMVHRAAAGKPDAWQTLISATQTQLLMAEARYNGWITTSTVQDYYENAIVQALTQKDKYSTTKGGDSPITTEQIDAYLAEPRIAFNENTALQQINEQYWVECFLDWHEGWCNFRRSGYPALEKNPYPGADPSVKAGDGFIHRMPYPENEYTVNPENVKSAAAGISGGDELGSRVFWDTP